MFNVKLGHAALILNRLLRLCLCWCLCSEFAKSLMLYVVGTWIVSTRPALQRARKVKTTTEFRPENLFGVCAVPFVRLFVFTQFCSSKQMFILVRRQ